MDGIDEEGLKRSLNYYSTALWGLTRLLRCLTENVTVVIVVPHRLPLAPAQVISDALDGWITYRTCAMAMWLTPAQPRLY